MKKFQFGLETLLRHRKVEEDLAKRDHESSVAELNVRQTHKQHMENEKHLAHQERSKTNLQDPNALAQMQLYQEFLVGQDVRLKRQDQKIDEARAQVETFQEILRQRAINRKLIERLKEKKKSQHDTEVGKELQKRADDMSLMRFNLKKK